MRETVAVCSSRISSLVKVSCRMTCCRPSGVTRLTHIRRCPLYRYHRRWHSTEESRALYADAQASEYLEGRGGNATCGQLTSVVSTPMRTYTAWQTLALLQAESASTVDNQDTSEAHVRPPRRTTTRSATDALESATLPPTAQAPPLLDLPSAAQPAQAPLPTEAAASLAAAHTLPSSAQRLPLPTEDASTVAVPTWPRPAESLEAPHDQLEDQNSATPASSQVTLPESAQPLLTHQQPSMPPLPLPPQSSQPALPTPLSRPQLPPRWS